PLKSHRSLPSSLNVVFTGLKPIITFIHSYSALTRICCAGRHSITLPSPNIPIDTEELSRGQLLGSDLTRCKSHSSCRSSRTVSRRDASSVPTTSPASIHNYPASTLAHDSSRHPRR